MATKDFIEYSPSSGNKNSSVSVTTSKNTGASRNTLLKIQGKGITKEISIRQDAEILYELFSIGAIICAPIGESLQLNIISDLSPNVLRTYGAEITEYKNIVNQTINLKDSIGQINFYSLSESLSPKAYSITLNFKKAWDMIVQSPILVNSVEKLIINSSEKNTNSFLDLYKYFEAMVYDLDQYISDSPDRHFMLTLHIADLTSAQMRTLQSSITVPDRFVLN